VRNNSIKINFNESPLGLSEITSETTKAHKRRRKEYNLLVDRKNPHLE